VATVRIAPAPTVIRHDNISRSLDVTASVRGRGAGAVRDGVRTRLAGLAMPLEYHAEVMGPAAGAGAGWRVGAVAVAVAIGLLLVFQAAFGSWRPAGLLLLALPLASAGGLVAALFLGDGSGAAVLAGLLMVVGLAARHGLLVVHTLRRHERDAEPVPVAIREVAAPVVLTVLLTAAVLLSLVLWGGAAGAALLGPMAVVVLGGLVTSTVVTVLVVPALYLRLSPVDQGRPT
jgi:multidrug efflux pump subunit AcrB